MNLYVARYVYQEKPGSSEIMEVPERFFKAKNKEAVIKVLEGEKVDRNGILEITRVTRSEIEKRIVRLEIEAALFREMIS